MKEFCVILCVCVCVVEGWPHVDASITSHETYFFGSADTYLNSSTLTKTSTSYNHTASTF